MGASEATLLQMLKIFPFSYGLIVKQGQHYYHTQLVDHTVVDTAVLIDVSYRMFVAHHHVYSSNQCPPPTVYDSGAVFSPTVLDISDDDLIRHFTEVWRQQVLVVYDILLDTLCSIAMMIEVECHII